MRIAILAAGSRGDIQPLLGLAGGLRGHGHDIVFCAQALFEPVVLQQQFQFFELGGADPRKVWAEDLKQRPKTRWGRLWRVLHRPGPSLERLSEYEAACRSVDAMVCGTSLGVIGRCLAERWKKPLVLAHLYPAHPTRIYANPSTPQPPFSNEWLNLTTHILARQMFWAADRSSINAWRTQKLKLPPWPFGAPLRNWREDEPPAVFGFSPAVVPKPADWPDSFSITGYWWMANTVDPEPADSLKSFLGAGAPPVSVGFGSIVEESGGLAATVAEAIAAIKRRAVLVQGWGKFEGSLPDSVHVVESVNYSWLFPQVSVAVHAGGAGTTAEAIRAGIPSVVVPFGGDQNFWARRLTELGVAPPPIPRAQLTSARLAEAIERAATDGGMRERARQLGQKVAQENGPAAAAAFISRYFEAHAHNADLTSARV
jgi:sterol 3beta-glucosyltransferase